MSAIISPTLLETKMPVGFIAAEDPWRFTEDDNWPSQLISSNDQEGALDNNNQEHHARPKEPVRTNDLQTLEEESYQHAPTKAKVFARPASAHEDPAAGFSFTKAPVQSFDFSRKPRQAPGAFTHDVPHLSPDGKDSPASQQLTHTKPKSPSCENEGTSSRQNLLAPKGSTAPCAILAVPFPNVSIPASIKHERAGTKSGTVFYPASELASGPPKNAPAMSADDNLVGPGSNEPRCAPSAEKLEMVQPSRSSEGQSLFESQPDQMTSTIQNPLSVLLQPANKQRRVLKTTNPGPSKVLKKRRKKPSTEAGNNITTRPPITQVYNEEELLHLLMIRHRHSQRERETFQAAQQAHEHELQRLKDWASELQVKLQDTQQRCTEKEAQLSKFKAAKPGWERKVKKLSDYLQGLTNDHNRLRDDATDLQERSNSLLKEREGLVHAVQDVREDSIQQNRKTMQLATKAHHELEMREQTVQYQQSELQSLQKLLFAERERNDRLEGEISTIAVSYGQLSGQLSGNRDNIMRKINELLESTEGFRANAPSESQDYLKSMLEKCVTLLQNIQDAGSSKPEDFERLNDSMRGYFEGIICSIEACEHSTSVTEVGHQQLAALMQEQLRALSSNLTAEQNRSDQVMDLREVKATLRERLQVAETALREARIDVAALQRKDRDQSNEIVALKTEIAKPQRPVDNTQILLRLQEIDSRNKDLQREVDHMQTTAASLSAQVQEKANEAERSDERLIDTQVQLQEARRETEVVRDERLEFEKEALQQREDLKRDLLNAASTELEKLKNEHLDQIQQLELRKSPGDKLSQATKQCIILRSEKDALEQQASQLKSSLTEMQKERRTETAFAARLNARVAELEEQITYKDDSFSKLQDEMQATMADNEVKDGCIKRLQEYQEKWSQQARKVGISTSIHDSQISKHFKKPQPVIVGDSHQGRDSHPSLIRKNSELSEHAFKPLPAVVEVTQLKGYARSMTPVDIEEDSQSITEDDLMNLFAITPVAQTHNVKMPQVSLSQSRGENPEKGELLREQRKEPRQTLPEAKSKEASTAKHNGLASLQSSAHGFTAPSKSPPKAGQLQCPNQAPAVKPRGILKGGSTRAKRDASVANINDTNNMAPIRKRKSNLASLGPVIEDSQSQSRLPSIRSRMPSTKNTRKSTKDDKMNHRFSQELRRSLEL